MQKCHMPKMSHAIYFEGLNRGRKEKNKTPLDELMVSYNKASVQWSDELVHYVKKDQSTQTVG
jgi:hypothetical protein